MNTTLSGLGLGHAVDKRPHVAEPARGELDAQFGVQFRVAVKPAARRAVVEQAFHGHLAVECGKGVLQRHAVSAFVEMHRVEPVRAFHEGVGDERLGHDAVRATRVAAQPARARHGGEENDRVAHDLDIRQQLLPLLFRHFACKGVNRHGLVCRRVHGECHVGSPLCGCAAAPQIRRNRPVVLWEMLWKLAR